MLANDGTFHEEYQKKKTEIAKRESDLRKDHEKKNLEELKHGYVSYEDARAATVDAAIQITGMLHQTGFNLLQKGYERDLANTERV